MVGFFCWVSWWRVVGCLGCGLWGGWWGVEEGFYGIYELDCRVVNV